MPHPLIQVDAVSYQQKENVILSNISLAIYPHQIVSLIGPNGAGKTTLLKILLGLIKPTTGKLTRLPGLRVGYMPQRLIVDPTLPVTVERFLKLLTGITNEQVKQTLARVGVQDCQQRFLQHLSGGELQRVLLARALLSKPQLLVLDEPAQGLDVMGQVQLYRDISKIRDELQCAIVLVSHDLHLVMAATDEVICINRHICCSGHPEIVTKDPAYLKLFGNYPVNNLAFYTHHHDHCHDQGSTHD